MMPVPDVEHGVGCTIVTFRACQHLPAPVGHLHDGRLLADHVQLALVPLILLSQRPSTRWRPTLGLGVVGLLVLRRRPVTLLQR